MKKTITFELSPISVTINVDEKLSQEELLELGKSKLVKQIQKEFPFYRYSITEGTIMSDEEITVGRPVKLKDSGKIGIIYEIKPSTKFPIRVITEGNKEIQCTKSAIEKVSKNTSIEKLIKGRCDWQKSMGWLGVNTAFFVNGDEIIPVIVYAGSKGKTKAIIVGHDAKGSYYTITSSNQNRLLDTKVEAEEFLTTYKTSRV